MNDTIETYWAEMYHVVEKEFFWFKFDSRPHLSLLSYAHTVIMRDSNGIFKYVKNKKGNGTLRNLNDEEIKMMDFIILKATERSPNY